MQLNKPPINFRPNAKGRAGREDREPRAGGPGAARTRVRRPRPFTLTLAGFQSGWGRRERRKAGRTIKWRAFPGWNDGRSSCIHLRRCRCPQEPDGVPDTGGGPRPRSAVPEAGPGSEAQAAGLTEMPPASSRGSCSARPDRKEPSDGRGTAPGRPALQAAPGLPGGQAGEPAREAAPVGAPHRVFVLVRSGSG